MNILWIMKGTRPYESLESQIGVSGKETGIMEYCVPYDMKCIELPRMADHPPGISSSRRPARLLSTIAWLFAPEPSDLRHKPATFQPAAWKDSLKGLFWVAVSIGIGMLLAIMCS